MFVETKREGEAQTEPKPSLAGFAAWLENKEPDEIYNWADCRGGCAVSQYFSSLTKSLDPIASLWRDYGGELDPLARKLPHTFGALLTRARRSLSGG
jgi:hypothetical protein